MLYLNCDHGRKWSQMVALKLCCRYCPQPAIWREVKVIFLNGAKACRSRCRICLDVARENRQTWILNCRASVVNLVRQTGVWRWEERRQRYSAFHRCLVGKHLTVIGGELITNKMNKIAIVFFQNNSFKFLTSRKFFWLFLLRRWWPETGIVAKDVA